MPCSAFFSSARQSSWSPSENTQRHTGKTLTATTPLITQNLAHTSHLFAATMWANPTRQCGLQPTVEYERCLQFKPQTTLANVTSRHDKCFVWFKYAVTVALHSLLLRRMVEQVDTKREGNGRDQSSEILGIVSSPSCV